MNETQIRQIKPMLSAFLKRFDDCFMRRDTGSHLHVYVEGQLSNLERKSVEPMALPSLITTAKSICFPLCFTLNALAVVSSLRVRELSDTSPASCVLTFASTSSW